MGPTDIEFLVDQEPDVIEAARLVADLEAEFREVRGLQARMTSDADQVAALVESPKFPEFSPAGPSVRVYCDAALAAGRDIAAGCGRVLEEAKSQYAATRAAALDRLRAERGA